VFHGRNGVLPGQFLEMLLYPLFIPAKYLWNESGTDDVPRGFSEITAVRLIDKDMSPVRTEPGDKFCLILDYCTVPFFAFSECLLSIFTIGNVPDGFDRADDIPVGVIEWGGDEPEISSFPPI
jgi:hypothetical protein